MKKSLFLIGLIFCAFKSISQEEAQNKKFEIDAFYNWSMTGRSISVIANKPFKQHVISFGVKYHDNHFITDNQNYSYKNRFREEKLKEALGMNLGYRFDFIKQNEVVNPYVFYLLQASYLRLIRNYTYDPYSGNTAGFVLIDVTDPFYIFEHVIGVGIQTKLFKGFYLNQSAGMTKKT